MAKWLAKNPNNYMRKNTTTITNNDKYINIISSSSSSRVIASNMHYLIDFTWVSYSLEPGLTECKAGRMLDSSCCGCCCGERGKGDDEDEDDFAASTMSCNDCALPDARLLSYTSFVSRGSSSMLSLVLARLFLPLLLFLPILFLSEELELPDLDDDMALPAWSRATNSKINEVCSESLSSILLCELLNLIVSPPLLLLL